MSPGGDRREEDGQKSRAAAAYCVIATADPGGRVLGMAASSDIAARIASAGQLLVRSGIEIDRILSGIAEEGANVSASLRSSEVFISRLISVDPVRQRMLLQYSELPKANAALLAERSVLLRCNHRGAAYAFSAKGPCEALHRQQPAIRLGVPTQVYALKHRHTPKLSPMPAQAPIECQLRLGVLAFDARLVDVSLDGRAFLLHDDAVPLCAGTRVAGARIRHPERAPLTVDLDITHVIPEVRLGKRATRISCRILATRGDLEDLIRLFIIDLL